MLLIERLAFGLMVAMCKLSPSVGEVCRITMAVFGFNICNKKLIGNCINLKKLWKSIEIKIGKSWKSSRSQKKEK